MWYGGSRGEETMGDMTVYEREPPKGTTLEDIWALFRESDRRMQETERTLKEMGVETDRRMRKTERAIKETGRQIGNLGGRLGEVIEHIMTPKLYEKFEELDLCFTRASRNYELRGQNRKTLAEVDVFLENGEYAMAVEVKTRLTVEDVQDHVKRLEILRKAADEHKDQRKYLGAVAGAVVDQKVSAYARKTGFYVIIPSGEAVEIKVPEGCMPRMW
jgi:hypothetical protein